MTLHIVFKLTLYELCLCIYYVIKRSAVFLKMTKSFNILSVALHHDYDQQIAYFKRSALFMKMTKSFRLLSVALKVNIISIEHDQ